MRSISVIFTLGGLIFFALLIGLMSDSISEYMDTLHSGNSRVLVRDHVLMLGWSEKIHSMLTERGSDVYSSTCKKFVVLAENPIEETDLEDRGVIFRRGHPSVVSDLIKVSPNTARSVIVFSPKCKDDDEADALVMARTMALISLDVKVPIVIEIRDRDNLAVVQKMLHGQTQLLHHKHRVVPLAGSDIAGKMVVQGALQPGLAKVVHHLLDWNSADQNDVHVQSIDRLPNVEGRTYGEAVFMFDDAIILGVMADRLQGVEGCPPNSCMLLNPPNDLVLQKGDKLCAVARSKDLFGPRDKPVRDSLGVLSLQHVQPDYQQKHLLIFNWRDDMEDMFRDIDKRVGKGSVVTVVSEFTKKERDELLEEGGGLRTLKNIKINHVRGQTVKQRVVKKVMSETHVDCVIVFSEDIEKHAPTADAKAVVCGLLVESLLPENGKCQTNPDNVEGQCAATESLLQPVSIITEIKERRSLQVLRVAGVSNFVIANELSGMMMVHLALEPDLRHFWIDNVFSALQGNNIDISLVDVYTHGLQPDVLAAMTFWDLLASCRYRGVTPIAIKRASDRTFTFNPADKNAPLKLKAGDTVVVVAPCHE